MCIEWRRGGKERKSSKFLYSMYGSHKEVLREHVPWSWLLLASFCNIYRFVLVCWNYFSWHWTRLWLHSGKYCYSLLNRISDEFLLIRLAIFFSFNCYVFQARGSMLMFVAAFLTFMAIGGFPSFVEDMKVCLYSW